MNKNELRKSLAEGMKAYLEKGGTVKKIPEGVTKRSIQKVESKIDYSALPAELKAKLNIKES